MASHPTHEPPGTSLCLDLKIATRARPCSPPGKRHALARLLPTPRRERLLTRATRENTGGARARDTHAGTERRGGHVHRRTLLRQPCARGRSGNKGRRNLPVPHDHGKARRTPRPPSASAGEAFAANSEETKSLLRARSIDLIQTVADSHRCARFISFRNRHASP